MKKINININKNLKIYDFIIQFINNKYLPNI